MRPSSLRSMMARSNSSTTSSKLRIGICRGHADACGRGIAAVLSTERGDVRDERAEAKSEKTAAGEGPAELRGGLCGNLLNDFHLMGLLVDYALQDTPVNMQECMRAAARKNVG